jgi:hypothetical protein
LPPEPHDSLMLTHSKRADATAMRRRARCRFRSFQPAAWSRRNRESSTSRSAFGHEAFI